MCRFANRSNTMNCFNRIVQNLSQPGFVLVRDERSCQRWELDEGAVASMATKFEMSISVPVYKNGEEVDIQFVAEGYEGRSISGFPAAV